jgi:hypothetical protein
LTASFNGAELFTFKEDTFKDAGAFGLWSKPNNVTYFDDLRGSVVSPWDELGPGVHVGARLHRLNRPWWRLHL